PDDSVETAACGGVATLFLAFGLFAGLVVVVGFVLAFAEGTLHAVHAWPRPSALLRDLKALCSDGVLGLGLALLLALPIVRNVAVSVVLLRRRQRRAAALALVTTLVLIALYAFLTLRGAPGA